MDPELVPARQGDIDTLVGLMREYYAYDHLVFDESVARTALGEVIADASLGRIWLLRHNGAPAGYVVLAMAFSLEFHGRTAFIDELYLREEYRRQGTGTRILRFLQETCRNQGMHAVRLEVERSNSAAQAAYRKAGFTAHDRVLMTKRLTPESHGRESA